MRITNNSAHGHEGRRVLNASIQHSSANLEQVIAPRGFPLGAGAKLAGVPVEAKEGSLL
jgi:hypothetical protein